MICLHRNSTLLTASDNKQTETGKKKKKKKKVSNWECRNRKRKEKRVQRFGIVRDVLASRNERQIQPPTGNGARFSRTRAWPTF